MGEFLKWIGRFLGGPISLIGDNLKFLSNSVFGTDFSNRYNDIYNIFNGSYVPEDSNIGSSADIQNSGVLSDVQNLLHSVAGRYAGTELTGAEREQNAWTAMREDTRYQNAVADMQAAGLNPALMYGGASTPAVNSSAGGIAGSGSLSDLLAFAMLPLQMKAMQADIDKTEADTKNTQANTANIEKRTEWIDALSQAEVESKTAGAELDRNKIREIDANISRAEAEVVHLIEQAKTEEEKRELMLTQEVINRASAQRIQELLPFEKLLMSAQTDSERAEAEYKLAMTAFQNRLINSDYIDNVIKSMGADTTVKEVEAWLLSDQYGRENESTLEKIGHTLVSGLNMAVKIISPIKTTHSSSSYVEKHTFVN